MADHRRMRFINTGPCHLLLLSSWLKQLSRSSSQADLPALLCCKRTKAASTQAVGASPPLACRQITFHTKLAASEIRSAHLERLIRPRWSAVRGCCGRCARQVRHLGLHKRQQKKAEQSALKQAILGAHTQVLASDWAAAGRAPCWRPARCLWGALCSWLARRECMCAAHAGLDAPSAPGPPRFPPAQGTACSGSRAYRFGPAVDTDMRKSIGRPSRPAELPGARPICAAAAWAACAALPTCRRRALRSCRRAPT